MSDTETTTTTRNGGQGPTPSVGLFVTCLVDLFRPRIGFAAVSLLEAAGYAVEVPQQGCCGQPNFNGGDRNGARAMARRAIGVFRDFDYVVAPSGSCAGMLKVHYPSLFEPGTDDRVRAVELASRSYELTSFLHDVAGTEAVDAALSGTAAYHDACAGLRELQIRQQPRHLLKSVAGLELTELKQPDVCCGFGGTFCVKYPDVSDRIVEKKITDIIETGADYLISGDLGCLLSIAGKLNREGADVIAVHVAEVLAGVAGDDGNRTDADD